MRTPQLLREIKQEFQEKFGVKVDVDLYVHNCPGQTEQTANYICAQFDGKIKHMERDEIYWAQKKHLAGRIIVFYEKEKTAEAVK